MARHDATETIIGIGPSTVIHDQDIANGEARLAGELAATDWLAVGLVLPLRVFKTSIRYLDPAGQQVAIENPFIHHHNETLVGPGDPWLVGRVALRGSGFTLGARLGVSLPLGRTVDDPFTLGDMALPHEHSQFGTGTLEPVIGLDVSRAIGGVRVDAFALSVQSLYANGHGYRAGDRYAGGAGAASALGTQRGRTDVLAGWHVGASLKLPIYTRVAGGQLEQTAFAGISIGTQLHLFEDTAHHHHHDHDHGAEVAPGDWSGLDEQDVTDDGSAVPLVPVPGKITVFDFWATWCEPCREVDHELAEIARRHPGALAVRKLNVVDVDSPASKKYLGPQTLPHLKVFDRDGKLLWERSAPPDVLTGEVERLLTGAR